MRSVYCSLYPVQMAVHSLASTVPQAYPRYLRRPLTLVLLLQYYSHWHYIAPCAVLHCTVLHNMYILCCILRYTVLRYTQSLHCSVAHICAVLCVYVLCSIYYILYSALLYISSIARVGYYCPYCVCEYIILYVLRTTPCFIYYTMRIGIYHIRMYIYSVELQTFCNFSSTAWKNKREVKSLPFGNTSGNPKWAIPLRTGTVKDHVSKL